MAWTGLGDEVAIFCPTKDDTGNGTGVLTDLSGLHSNGTISGASWVADTEEGGVRALSFDGTNDLVSIANIALGSSPWSFSVWAKFTSFSNYAPIMSFTDAGGENYEPAIYGNTQNDSDNDFGSWWESSDPDNGYSSTQELSTATWYSLGVAYGADGYLRYYVDGVAKGSTNWGTLSVGNSTIYLGHQAASFYGNLLLDDIRFFDVALTQANFATLATARGHGLTNNTTTITGAAAINDAPDTVAAVGITDGTIGTAAITDEDDAIAASGSVSTSGAASITDDDDTVTAAGSTPISGEATITDDADTLVSEGDNFAHGAVGNITDEPDTVVAVISTERSGTASITDDSDTVSATGDNFAEGGFANITDASDTLAATGSVAVAGTAAITDDADTIASSGTSTNLQRRGFVPRNLSPMSMTLGA